MEKYYPVGPGKVPDDLTLPTRKYKYHAWLAMFSLLLFVLIYLLLTGWFMWTAYRELGGAVAGGKDNVVQFLVGACSGFLALFMIKALFFVQRGSAGEELEITEQEQPRLFAFLNRIADEAAAPRPKRVYLSARVNACVFYDLSILNLLFPSRKNLEIGLALVNVMTLSELKAVLAHEFGHFAQRTMAIGIWVYIARQIAVQVIAKRDALDKFLRFLSGIDVRIAWLGWLLSLIVWSIRSLMDTLLNVVVLAQRALSRQMEFQADLVAVSLTGSNELVNALHKLQAADDAWDRAIRFANVELYNKRIPHDLFEVQTSIIEKMASILNDEDYGKVPRATGDAAAFRVFKPGMAQAPHMWSTHPANHDRENNAKRVYIDSPHDERSAWVLFDDVDGVKQRVANAMIQGEELVRSSREETLTNLAGSYDKLKYDSRFRGAYIGRPLTRHVASASELYEEVLNHDYVPSVLGTLYGDKFAENLVYLKELEEELVTLQALRDKVYQATGGRIVYRGREISRRELPAAIRQVSNDADAARQYIFDHDRRCRGAHLAAASKLGNGWHDYLLGLITTLHYSEHALANLRDAQGLLNNVYAVVTADGKVSKAELTRLIATANVLYGALEAVYKQGAEITLDASLCTRLDVTSWAEMLEEFKLPPAAQDNINQWLQVIDGWVDSAAGALSSLNTAVLEQLLQSEDTVARHFHEKTAIEQAPQPSIVPTEYPTLVSGSERKRQTRLGLWDRFMTADGWFAATARLLVALTIVGAVLGFSAYTGSESTVTVYNGLGVTANVHIDDSSVIVAPFASRDIDVTNKKMLVIKSYAPDGTLIDSLAPQLNDYAEHYVYNIAAASPLVEWTAVYGSAHEQPPTHYGAAHWLTSSADVLFKNPPEQISSKSGGGTRTVLSGMGDGDPESILGLARSDIERKQLVLAHANWDRPGLHYTAKWRAIAAREYAWVQH